MSPRVLVTRAEDQAGPLEIALGEVGLEAVVVPSISVKIDPPGGLLDAAASNLQWFAWVVVTSPNGARAILTAAERVFTALGTPLWAAIGEATALVLEREGIEIDFRPSRADGRTLAAELPVRPGQEVLLLRGDLATDEVPELLRARGADVTDVVAYRTIEAPAASRPRLRRAFAPGPPAAVLFASGSAARGLVALAEAEQLDIGPLPAVCIGPETALEAMRLGFDVIATAPTPDPASLAGVAAAALAQPVEMP
jgi:uroporphyrinogen-III synthase